jgi:integrase/recombinase XerD
MKILEASKLWLEYHRAHSKQNSIRAYEALIGLLYEEFGNANLDDVSSGKILSLINRITEGRKPTTKRTRYSHLLAFFNFVKNNIDPDFRNPCDTPMMKKLFRARPSHNWIPHPRLREGLG